MTHALKEARLQASVLTDRNRQKGKAITRGGLINHGLVMMRIEAERKSRTPFLILIE